MRNLLLVVVLLAGNAFFVAGEFSLIAARRTVVEPLAATSKRARLALSAMAQLPLMIAGAQLGVTVCSLGLGAIAEPAMGHLLDAALGGVHLPRSFADPLAFLFALIVVVFAHTVIGEMVPKNLTLVAPEQAVLWLGPPMLWFCTATRPLLVFMRWAARQVLRIWRIEAAEAVKTVYTAEELAGLVAQARTEGLLDPEEHARITGALALHERTAAEAMRPWPAVTTVTEDVAPAQLEELATRTGLSRFPVVVRRTGRVAGFVHIKDVLAVGTASLGSSGPASSAASLGSSGPASSGPARDAPIPAQLIRPLPVVPPDRRLAETLLAMRRERRHIVLVTDGRAPLGLLTLYDVLRAVVGMRVGDTASRADAIPN